MNKILSVFVDASILNDKCGAGVVIMTDKDRLIYKRHMNLSKYKDTVKAEMYAIEKGIQIGLKKSRKKEGIVIYNDCIVAIARAKLKFPTIQIEWIPRKSNFADLLSRRSVTNEEFEEWKKQKGNFNVNREAII